MTEPPDNSEDYADAPLVPGEDEQSVPVESDEFDEQIEAPRRAASAEFIVDSGPGSQALLREAMDPANQSLREALRLSFRVLQVVILVLIVLFVFSGFQKVENQYTGVMLRWGEILGEPGQQELGEGLKFSKWPYPAGEFVLFQNEGRSVDVAETFWPHMRAGQTLDQAVQAATQNRMLRPGQDGLLLSRDGDIGHMKLNARYQVANAVAFVHCVENEHKAGDNGLDADKLVELALERAAVHAAAKLSVQELIDFSEQSKDDLRAGAQRLLDDVGAGVRIVQVDTPEDPQPALAIRKAYGDLQEVRGTAATDVEKARQDAEQTLLAVAGEQYQVLLSLIEQYEDALDLGEDQRAEEILAGINERLESPETTGQVSNVIYYARSFRSTIGKTVGRDAQRLSSHIEQYRQNPQLTRSRLWRETRSRVLGREDVEIFQIPAVSMVSLSLSRLDEIAQLRREISLKRKEAAAWTEGLDLGAYGATRAGSMNRRLDRKPGRQLDASGRGYGGGDSH